MYVYLKKNVACSENSFFSCVNSKAVITVSKSILLERASHFSCSVGLCGESSIVNTIVIGHTCIKREVEKSNPIICLAPPPPALSRKKEVIDRNERLLF